MELSEILTRLAGYREAAAQVRDIVIANTIMIGEFPASTFQEEDRLEFVRERWRASGLQNTQLDAAGNASGVLPGSGGDAYILVSAHADTLAVADPSLSVDREWILGREVADNTFGLAVVLSLPEILRAMGITLQHSLILVGAAASLGEGDLRGLRFLLEHIDLPIRGGVCVEGVELGRLSHDCLGMVRGEIITRVPASGRNANLFEEHNAIIAMHRILERILTIPIPQHPRTSVMLGSLEAGKGYNSPARKAELRFEVRSEEVGMVRRIRREIDSIVEEVSARTGARNTLRLLAQRRPGGIPFAHPLVTATREILRELGVEPAFSPSVSDLAALISHGIPAVTLGVTRGRNYHEADEAVEIEPMMTGLAQLAGVLQFIDGNPLGGSAAAVSDARPLAL